MLIVSVVSVIAVLLSWCARDKRFRFLFELAMIIVTFLVSIRYDYGNDYRAYLAEFQIINSGVLSRMEIGWVLLCKVCRPVGFMGMVILLSIIENYLIYRFIKRYSSPEWYWLAMFTYLFVANIMLLGCSMMRQFLAMVIGLNSVKYIEEKKFLKYLLAALLAMSFHMSAILILPLYFLNFFINIMGKRIGIAGLVVFFLLIVYYRETFFINLSKIFLQTEAAYTSYLVWGEGGGWGIRGFLISFITVLGIATSYNTFTDSGKIIVLVLVLSFLISPFYELLVIFARLNLYFIIFSICAYPIILNGASPKILKYILVLAFIANTLIEYFGFFHSDVYGKYFINYQTIFSAPKWI